MLRRPRIIYSVSSNHLKQIFVKMTYNKDFYSPIVMLLLTTYLVNSTLSKSVNTSLEQGAKNKSILAEKELLEFTFKNLNDLYINYGGKVDNLMENALKDNPLKTNVTNILGTDFKIHKNLTYTGFVEILLELNMLVRVKELIKVFSDKTIITNEALRVFSLKVFEKELSEHLDVQAEKALKDFFEKLKQKFEAAKTNFTKRVASKLESSLKQEDLALFIGILCKSSNTDCGEELNTYAQKNGILI